MCDKQRNKYHREPAYITKIENYGNDLSERYNRLNTNFEIFCAQYNPDVMIDSNADGSYDLN